MAGQLSIGLVDRRAVAVRFAHRSLEVVRNQQFRYPAEEGEHPLVGGDPVWKALAPGGLGEGVAGGAQHCHKDLCPAHFTGRAIHHGHGRAAVVDKDLLTGTVDLTHATALPATPESVVVAVLAVAVGLVAVAFHVLGPEQLQGDAFGLELLMDLEVIGLGKA